MQQQISSEICPALPPFTDFEPRNPPEISWISQHRPENISSQGRTLFTRFPDTIFDSCPDATVQTGQKFHENRTGSLKTRQPARCFRKPASPQSVARPETAGLLPATLLTTSGKPARTYRATSVHMFRYCCFRPVKPRRLSGQSFPAQAPPDIDLWWTSHRLSSDTLPVPFSALHLTRYDAGSGNLSGYGTRDNRHTSRRVPSVISRT